MALNVPHWTNPSWARWLLPLGLIGGVLLPQVGHFVSQWIPWLIGLLLFVACLSIDWQTTQVKQAISPALFWVLMLQFLLPTIAAIALAYLNLAMHWRIPILFVLAAAPVTGSPNMVAMLNGSPQHALATLLIGTAALPLTALPMLWSLQSVASDLSVLPIVGRLILTIALAVAAALVIQRMAFRRTVTVQRKASLNLIAACLLAVIVLGLMSGFHAPNVTAKTLISMLVFVCLLNAGLHWLGLRFAKLTQRYANSLALTPVTAGIMTGNRNVALLLTALPLAAIEPHLLFLACYQIPMYLTPLIAAKLYRR